MIIDGSHASSSEDEFEKELDLLEQRKSPDQAISSTLYANAQIKQKVTSSIEKMERLGRLKADSVWKIIDTLDEPLLTTAKILSTMPVTQVSVERLFSSMKFILNDHRRVVNWAGLFRSGSGSGLTFWKTSGLFRARYDAYNQTFKKQNYSVTLYLFYEH